MPTKPLDRLMFAQGGLCFFCKQPLPKAEASVEHLVASAKGGGNNDENRVACCKAVNALLGSMSLKEKFQVVLNQRGVFKCPNGVVAARPAPTPPTAARKPVAHKAKANSFSSIVENLEKRGSSRPRTLKTLTSTVAALLPKGYSEAEVSTVVEHLKTSGKVLIADGKVSYAF